MGPEAEAGVGDEEDLFAVDCVHAVAEGFGVVALHHRGEVAVTEADAFDFFACEMAGAPGDGEAAFRRCVDEVSGGAQFGGDVGVFADGFERGGRAVVAVFADERVDGLVFAELFHAGREDDELGAVGERHAGAIDGLVAEPGGVKLVRVKIDDGLLDRLGDDFEVDLEAELGGAAGSTRCHRR